MTRSLESIGWHAFLARPRFPAPQPQVLKALRGQAILISGAGGSIGSVLALAGKTAQRVYP
ncbi:MAG: hypothetical protein KGM96_06295 [Acidobacteriota bacterium]|nr:hypothetical protein [Acidobacteriota bacterium]